MRIIPSILGRFRQDNLMIIQDNPWKFPWTGVLNTLPPTYCRLDARTRRGTSLVGYFWNKSCSCGLHHFVSTVSVTVSISSTISGFFAEILCDELAGFPVLLTVLEHQQPELCTASGQFSPCETCLARCLAWAVWATTSLFSQPNVNQVSHQSHQIYGLFNEIYMGIFEGVHSHGGTPK